MLLYVMMIIAISSDDAFAMPADAAALYYRCHALPAMP